MARHDNNDSRGYLADEVKEQRKELTELVKQVAGMDVSVATLRGQYTDERTTARLHRQGVREEIADLTAAVAAQRGEQGQVAMSITAIQGDLAKVVKTLDEHETERQQRVWAFNLASAGAKIVWGVVVGIVIAIAGFAMWLYKVIGNLPAGMKGPGGGP